MISMSPETVNAGSGTATLDVNITGDGTTAFGSFTLDLAIAADPANTIAPLEMLAFQAPPSDPTLDQTLNDSTYVFFGNSANLDPLFPTTFGTLSGPNNNLLSLFDSTDDLSDITLANGESRLLARLVFVVPTNITNAGGDRFDVTLANPNSSPAALQSNINFPSDVPVSGAFTSVINVEEAAHAVVPEPATFGMMLAGMIGIIWIGRNRKPRLIRQSDCWS
jgi:hypothetical protein